MCGKARASCQDSRLEKELGWRECQGAGHKKKELRSRGSARNCGATRSLLWARRLQSGGSMLSARLPWGTFGTMTYTRALSTAVASLLLALATACGGRRI